MDPIIKILCVDDERNVLKALHRLFIDQENYDFFTAESGEEGLRILEEHPDVRLVISDYRMQGMNGVEFLATVCKKWPNTVRFVLSGFADTAAVVEAINLGNISKFIPKPWNDDDLKSDIAAALKLQELQFQIQLLNDELLAKNQQLEEININLESLVVERTESLEIRNRVLLIAQGVLDVLPVAVLGIDHEQLIVQCNNFARDLFPAGGIGPLGNDRRNIFSEEINRLVDRMEVEEEPTAVVEIHARKYRAEVRRLPAKLSKGVVVVLSRHE